MARWADFERDEPEMAAAGKGLIMQFGPGLAYLATVRADGGPRVHPICVAFGEGGMYAWILRHSPKFKDLLRDGRFALHSFAKPETDDEFYITGSIQVATNADIEARVKQLHLATGAVVGDEEQMVEFLPERALLATYETRPQWPPVYRKWLAS